MLSSHHHAAFDWSKEDRVDDPPMFRSLQRQWHSVHHVKEEAVAKGAAPKGTERTKTTSHMPTNWSPWMWME